MLIAETLSKDCRISKLLVYLLLMVNIKNYSIVFGLILELNMLNFRSLTIELISSFTIFLTHSIRYVLNKSSLFNIF